jgi:multiple sugar transport system ATP-binding protein
MTMGDRVTVMREGTLQQVGTPQHLYADPDNIVVAAFIGSPAMNLYDAIVGKARGSSSSAPRRSTCRSPRC